MIDVSYSSHSRSGLFRPHHVREVYTPYYEKKLYKKEGSFMSEMDYGWIAAIGAMLIVLLCLVLI